MFVLLVLADRAEEVRILASIIETRPFGTVADHHCLIVFRNTDKRFHGLRASRSQNADQLLVMDDVVDEGLHHHVRLALAVVSQQIEGVVPEDGLVHVDRIPGHGGREQDRLSRVEALAHGEYSTHIEEVLVRVLGHPLQRVVQVVLEPAAGDLLLAGCLGQPVVTIDQILVHLGGERDAIDRLEGQLRDELQLGPDQLRQPIRLVVAADFADFCPATGEVDGREVPCLVGYHDAGRPVHDHQGPGKQAGHVAVGIEIKNDAPVFLGRVRKIHSLLPEKLFRQ